MSTPRGGSAVMAGRVEPPDSLDYFPTPPWATRAFLEHVLMPLGAFSQNMVVWEPACGEGHMVRPLREYFATVHASDIYDYGTGHTLFDFLSLEPGNFPASPPFGPVDMIITNPPFGPANNPRLMRFALVALAQARVGIAFFGRIQMLEGEKRFQRIWGMWSRHALYAQHVERVALVKGRVDPEGSTASAYGWMLILKKRTFSALPDFRGAAIPTVFIPPCRDRLMRQDDHEVQP